MIKEEKSKSSIITDKKVKVLMIAEKPSTAITISRALSGKNLKKNREGIYQFEGYFKDVPAEITVSCVMGHVYQSDFLEIHNDRKKVDPLLLYDVHTRLVEAHIDNLVPYYLEDLSYDKDILCLWLDCDKEGENICYEVIYNCYKYMNIKNYRQIYRAKFSSLTGIDVKNAYKSIDLLPNKNISASVEARRLIDLKVGISFTRFLTNSILPKIKQKNTKVLSYGPCQTPTLWFVVNRENEIKNFIPREYHKLTVDIIIRNKSETLTFDNKFFEKDEIDKITEELKKEKNIKLENILERKIKENPPVGLNTVEMLRVASKNLKKSPFEIMKIAERLYSRGFISYPRTETTKYPSVEFCSDILKLFENEKEVGKDTAELISNLGDPIIRGVDFGDHPPITPCKKNMRTNLDGDEIKLYEIICYYFFASMSAPVEYTEKTFQFVVNSISLEIKHKSVVDEGFLKYSFWIHKPETKKVPILHPKVFYKFENPVFIVLKTQPPEYLSESDLIQLMEENKIGTDASMAIHIQNICLRNYVKIDEERKLIPSELGRSLINSISEIDSNLVKPHVRSQIENSVNEIAIEKKTYSEVVVEELAIYKAIYENLTQNTDKLYEKFGLV